MTQNQPHPHTTPQTPKNDVDVDVVDLLDQPWGDTAYSYWLSVPQHDTERVLANHLNGLGGQVEWSCALQQLKDHGDFVEATLSGERETEVVRARWVIGCDGGRSTVRDQAGITLKRAGITFGAHDVSWTSQFDLSHGVADRISNRASHTVQDKKVFSG